MKRSGNEYGDISGSQDIKITTNSVIRVNRITRPSGIKFDLRVWLKGSKNEYPTHRGITIDADTLKNEVIPAINFLLINGKVAA
jgi:hypothetical protein